MAKIKMHRTDVDSNGKAVGRNTVNRDRLKIDIILSIDDNNKVGYNKSSPK